MPGQLIAAALVLIVVVGPLVLGVAGFLRARSEPSGSTAPWQWTQTIRSTLLYTLAFNLTFFLQELFLVLPKAFTPGLHPTLFHNNHRWDGEHPLARLFQGTGALATLLSAAVCVWLLRRGAGRSDNTRLFLIWMAYCGAFMALPQVAIGALSAGSDVGMAMAYLQWPAQAKLIAGLLALAALPALALWLTRPLLCLADRPEQIASPGARTRFVFRTATLPLIVGTALIIPFRVPREWIEVVLLPAWVAVLGMVWMQAGAWRVLGVRAGGTSNASMITPCVATAGLLVVFQALLRPGVAFF